MHDPPAAVDARELVNVCNVLPAMFEGTARSVVAEFKAFIKDDAAVGEALSGRYNAYHTGVNNICYR